MAGFADSAALQAAIAAGQKKVLAFARDVTAPGEAAGYLFSTWPYGPNPPAGTAVASTTPGDTFTNDAAALTLPNTSPDRKYIVHMSAVGTDNAGIVLFDRLVAVSGVALNSTGDTTINSASLPRYTDGAGVLAYLEITTGSNATPFTISMNSYTKEDGTTGRAGGSVTHTAIAGRTLLPLPLQKGDRGVRAVATVNVSSASGAGAANLVLLKHLCTLPVIAGQRTELDFMYAQSAFPRVFDGASLMIGLSLYATATTDVWGEVHIAWD